MKSDNYSLFVINKKEDEHFIAKEENIKKASFRDLFPRINIPGIMVVTDPFEYQGTDQVLPIQPEQLFFMDELDTTKIKNSKVLEVGLGSGILSIFCSLMGAKKIIGLDINPRAKILTGYNSIINGVEDKIEIRDGSVDSVFKNVSNDKFDYIISNPPFEPTPPGMDYYLNSSAGIYGLDFLELLFKESEKLLNEGGHLQFVTMAPGDKNEPFLLRNLLNKYFPNKKIDVIVDTQPIKYKDFNERFIDYFGIEEERIELMNKLAKEDGVTDIYMCMVHYTKGEKGSITFTPTHKVYESWDTPLGSKESNNYIHI